MSYSTRVIAAFAMLLPIAVLARAQAVSPKAVATHAVLQAVDADSLDDYIRASMHTARIPGLALGVVQRDHVAYLKGYGIAGPDGRPVTAQTPFILGSTSKSSTALAVIQLVEAGKIDLDAPVTRYLPWFRTDDAAGSAEIRVRHLLHHTSGLPAYEGLQGLWANDQSRVALENGIRGLSSARLRHPAGLRYEYANENPRSLTQFRRLHVPLAVDLCSVGVIWIIVPATVHTPMAAIALFAPDAFAGVIGMTGLIVGCAIARIFFALRLRRAHTTPTGADVTALTTTATMQAMVQSVYGSPDVLSLRTIARPTLGAADVLVRVHAAALHIGDSFGVRGAPLVMRMVTGLFRPTPGVPGFDLAGVVEAVGSGVATFRPGDAVFGASHGTCAEFVSAPAGQLALKPNNLTFEQAAAVPTSALAALHGLRDAGGLERGQRVLINGAAGGIGTFAVQIAKAFGANVTGVCSTPNVDLVRSLGADAVIDYSKEDFTRAGLQYDLLFDNVENRSLSACRRALTPAGTLVLNSGTGDQGLGLLVRLLRPFVLSPFVRQNLRRYLSKPNHTDLAVLKEFIEAGTLRPVIDQTFPLQETPAALRHIETGHARGKVVITVSRAGAASVVQ
jgi:NADPH:quinone reductase-like Zn-dependent oxidoreductase